MPCERVTPSSIHKKSLEEYSNKISVIAIVYIHTAYELTVKIFDNCLIFLQVISVLTVIFLYILLTFPKHQNVTCLCLILSNLRSCTFYNFTITSLLSLLTIFATLSQCLYSFKYTFLLGCILLLGVFIYHHPA